MKYLLDTHILLWILFEPEKLSVETKKILEDYNYVKCVSVITFWEISMKFSKGKLFLQNYNPSDLPALCEKINLQIINLRQTETASLFNLSADFHKDPFDRMLIWQCIQNDYTFISDDKNVKRYISIGLKVLS